MSAKPQPLAEITATAIRVLSREIGPTNTARFLNQFTTGFGNYTDEREKMIDERTVEELIGRIKGRRTKAGIPKTGRKPVPPSRRRK